MHGANMKKIKNIELFLTVYRLLLLLAGSIVVLFVLHLNVELSERKGSCVDVINELYFFQNNRGRKGVIYPTELLRNFEVSAALSWRCRYNEIFPLGVHIDTHRAIFVWSISMLP